MAISSKFRFRFNYRAYEEERVQIGYLIKAPSSDVIEWLKENWKLPSGRNGFDFNSGDKRTLIEYLLSRRNDPLIDWGLARYGHVTKAIQKAYDRGDVSTQLAALANPRGSFALPQARAVMVTKKWAYLCALLHNEYLSEDIFTGIFKREGENADLSDDRWQIILQALASNKRLSQKYDETFLDGYSDYKYHTVFAEAWNLTKTVTADQKWASVLEDLLNNCLRQHSLEALDETLERWRIDPPIEDDVIHWYKRSSSFRLRSLIADFKKADKDLLQSDDPALRQSFYRRFEPSKFKDWPEFINQDGEEFVMAALTNQSLWSNSERRDMLQSLCWAAPDPNHHMDMPNNFRRMQEIHKSNNPSWFLDDKLTQNIPETPTLETLNAKLQSVIASLDANMSPAKKGRSPLPAWVWFLIGAAAVRLFSH